MWSNGDPFPLASLHYLLIFIYFFGCGAIHVFYHKPSLSQHYYIDTIQFRDRYFTPSHYSIRALFIGSLQILFTRFINVDTDQLSNHMSVSSTVVP